MRDKIGLHSVSIQTYGPEDTRALGEHLAKALRPGDILLLEGPFGAGKTTLVQGIARGLGVTEYVSSPSFVMINEYRGRLPVFHIDLYRQERMSYLTRLNLEEYLYDDGVSLVEWAENLPEELRTGATVLRLRLEAGEKRTIEVITPDERLAEAARTFRRGAPVGGES